MNKGKNELGSSAYEFLLVVFVCFILMLILLFGILKNSNNEKFLVLKYNAKIMAMNAIDYEMEQDNTVLYLDTMIEKDLISPIKNPFGKEELCDPFESKVTLKDNLKIPTLKCGSYLIEGQDLDANHYIIYKVGNWQNKQEKNMEEKSFYNLKKDGEYLFNQYYELDLFLMKVRKLTNRTFKSLEEIEDEYEIVEKKLYREKKIIKEIKKETTITEEGE